jgi:quercetin dioxygenase-like cupin family protein
MQCPATEGGTEGVRVFHYTDIQAQVAEEGAEGVTVRWVIDGSTGAPNFAMRVFEIRPAGHTPLHEHDWEHEVFILEGCGKVRGAAQERAFGPGDVIFIPEGERHQFINQGDQTVRLICCVPIRKTC